MPVPLPIQAARRRFYGRVTVVETSGYWREGLWVVDQEARRTIAGSFQSPSPLEQDIAPAGDAGLGRRVLYTRAKLPYYDVDSARQTFVEAEGKRWRVTDQHAWGPISQGLFVYSYERFHETREAAEAP